MFVSVQSFELLFFYSVASATNGSSGGLLQAPLSTLSRQRLCAWGVPLSLYSLHLLPPHHLIDYPHIALDYLHDLGADVFVGVVGHGDAVVAICVHLHGCVNGLKEALLVDAADEEAAFVEGFGPFGAGADADCGEGVADGGKEAALFGQSAAVGDYCEGVHLEAVVVVEAEGFVLDDARVEFESACFEPLAAAGVAAVEDGHIVFLRHCVDGTEEAEEVALGVDVFFAVGGEEYILLWL